MWLMVVFILYVHCRLPQELNTGLRNSGNVRIRTIEKEMQCTKTGDELNVNKNYLTIQEKVKKWNDGNINKVIRDNLYPLAKIIFDSDEELQYDGNICKVVMRYVQFEPQYKRMTEVQKESHRRDMWAVWSSQVSRGLDSKRHNQKAVMRKVFWGKCFLFYELLICT